MSDPMLSEGAKVVATVTDALKSVPLVLALLTFNMTFLALIAYSHHKERATWAYLMEVAVQSCRPIAE